MQNTSIRKLHMQGHFSHLRKNNEFGGQLLGTFYIE
jgi:hypothetical protein